MSGGRKTTCFFFDIITIDGANVFGHIVSSTGIECFGCFTSILLDGANICKAPSSGI